MPEINNIDQANIRDAEQVVPKFINVSNELFDSRLLSYFARKYDYDQLSIFFLLYYVETPLQTLALKIVQDIFHQLHSDGLYLMKNSFR